jgi:hypothetical protein
MNTEDLVNVVDQLRRMGNEGHRMIEAFENNANSDFDSHVLREAFMDSSNAVDMSSDE